MTPNETKQIALFIDAWLDTTSFQIILDTYDREIFEAWAISAPASVMEREQQYYVLQGTKQFVNFLRELQARRDKIIAHENGDIEEQEID